MFSLACAFCLSQHRNRQTQRVWRCLRLGRRSPATNLGGHRARGGLRTCCRKPKGYGLISYLHTPRHPSANIPKASLSLIQGDPFEQVFPL